MIDSRPDEFVILTDRLLDVQKRMDDAKIDFKAILSDFENLCRDIAEKVKNTSYRKKNRIIVRIMNHFLSKGLSLDESILLTSRRTHEPEDRIAVVYNTEKQEKRILNQHAKILMIRRLNALHYPKKEIARITGYSEKYVFDIMRKNNIRSH